MAISGSEAKLPKPLLKWAGGKRWLVPRLQPLWEPYRDRKLVELFCGGLAVALGLRPRQALLNDINPHAVNLYRWLQAGLTAELPLQNDPDTYYRYRARFNYLIANGGSGTAEAAVLFYYLNRTCYNGLCRFNGRGEFNVPFGRYNKISYTVDLRSYQLAFREWTFTSADFQQAPLEPGDFVYADPPYDVEFTRYAREDFDWDDQVRLAQWLTEHPGPVVMSNQATERIVALYRDCGFTLQFLAGPRRISCTGDRTPAREVLATKGLDISRASAKPDG